VKVIGADISGKGVGLFAKTAFYIGKFSYLLLSGAGTEE
tara:strand:- start:1024 stop:1140 length:117 start_codon:yes stop_codon:yes gene_type:complete